MPRSNPDHLATATEAAAYITKITGRPITPAAIRQWAHRGHIRRHGQRARATLYDLREVHTRATGHDPYDQELAEDQDACHTQPVFGMP